MVASEQWDDFQDAYSTVCLEQVTFSPVKWDDSTGAPTCLQNPHKHLDRVPGTCDR